MRCNIEQCVAKCNTCLGVIIYYDQSEFDIRCEWGLHGIQTLAPISDVVIIVDVLSFTTCVDIAVSNGATIFPYRFKDESAVEFAKSKSALLAGSRRDTMAEYSLSPASMTTVSGGTKLVLPSPNGSTLTLSTGNTLTIAGCLRNCQAVAEYAATAGNAIAVIPAGEKWEDGAGLRPAIEDLIGAGAIISFMKSEKSPEALIAQAAFEAAKSNIFKLLSSCSSGKELIERGFVEDVKLAAKFNCSTAVPMLKSGGYYLKYC